jgi:uncharacterized membrane protein YphA (DoxX/SURF4 family)
MANTSEMSPQPLGTDLPRTPHPERWLAVLRLTVGLWFLKSLFTKLSMTLVAGVIPVPIASDRWIATMPKLIAKYAAENPFPAYKAFLLDTVVPNHVFAHLTALGEVAVGLSLTLGLLTELGAAFGALQVIFYGLAVQHMSSGQQGFHVMLFAMMIAFLFSHAGRTWGLDGWLWPRLARRRLHWRKRSAPQATGLGAALALVATGNPRDASLGENAIPEGSE